MEFIQELPEVENIAFSVADLDLRVQRATNSESPFRVTGQSGNIKTLENDEFSPTKRTHHKAMMLEQYNQTGIKLKFIKDICPTPLLKQNLSRPNPPQQSAKPILPSGALGSFELMCESRQATNQCSLRLIKDNKFTSPANRAFIGRSSNFDRSLPESPFGQNIGNGLFHVELFQSNQYLEETPVSNARANHILLSPKAAENYI